MLPPDGRALAEAFADLSDALVADYDQADFLHRLAARCVTTAGGQAAGIMLGDQHGALRLMAASAERPELLELFGAAAGDSPLADAFATGLPVAADDLGASRWPGFAERCRAARFQSAYAAPVRLRDEVVGVLGLFSAGPGPLDEAAARTVRALANLTALALAQHRTPGYRHLLAEQLLRAVQNRALIEQAREVLAEELGLGTAAAFEELRGFASRVGRHLSDVATAVAAGDYAPASGAGLRLLLIRRFDLDSIAALRTAVRLAAGRHGLAHAQAYQFVQAVHEAAANAVRHGGGSGQLLIWRQGGDLTAEITDHGPGFPDAERMIASDPGGIHDGRGLWLINRVCAGLDIETGADGTRLTLHYPLDSPVAFTKFG